MSCIDECKMGKYKVKLHLEKEEKEFDDIDDVYIYIYETSGCIFPVEIRLSDYESVDTEEYNGCLFGYIILKRR